MGLAAGLPGHAQIGKGMWAMPDHDGRDAEDQNRPSARRGQYRLGAVADCRDLARHRIIMRSMSRRARRKSRGDRRRNSSAILTIPLADRVNWSPEEINEELENNAQGILGYVVRWIDHGVGCSKVPDIHDIGLMEDRATLRISSQHIANWLRHGICSEDQVRE